MARAVRKERIPDIRLKRPKISRRRVTPYYTDEHYTTWCNFDILCVGKD